MAKCIGSICQWKPEIVDLEKPEFIVEQVRQGESLLNARLEQLYTILLDIANDYNHIKQSALIVEFKLDCNQVQDSLNTKLARLQSEILSVMSCISRCQMATPTKHRYFILYSYGTIEKLQQLLHIVGRLSEIDLKVYNEEHRKLLVSEESVTIHSLTSIWTAAIKIMEDISELAKSVFNTESDPNEYDFIGQLEFSTAYLHHSKILVMDLIITSWIKFNSSLRSDELIDGIPFLCPCHCKVYIRLLGILSHSDKKANTLNEMLRLILDHQSRPSLMTHSARRYGVVPQEPCYVGTNPVDLAYFVIWHLYSLTRLVNEDQRPLVSDCRPLLESSFDVAMKLFLPSPSQNANNLANATFRLSPHQEERFKLMLLMLNSWYEKHNQKNNNNHVSVLIKLFTFFDTHWDLYESRYFNSSEFTINDLTIFQLFAKLFTETIPTYSSDGQAVQNQTLSEQETILTNLWGKLLERVQPSKKTKPPGTACQSKQ